MSSNGNIRAKKSVNRALRDGTFNPTRIGRAFPRVNAPPFFGPMVMNSATMARRERLAAVAALIGMAGLYGERR